MELCMDAPFGYRAEKVVIEHLWIVTDEKADFMVQALQEKYGVPTVAVTPEEYMGLVTLWEGSGEKND